MRAISLLLTLVVLAGCLGGPYEASRPPAEMTASELCAHGAALEADLARAAAIGAIWGVDLDSLEAELDLTRKLIETRRLLCVPPPARTPLLEEAT